MSEEAVREVEVRFQSGMPEKDPGVPVVERKIGKLWYRLGFVTRDVMGRAMPPLKADPLVQAEPDDEAPLNQMKTLPIRQDRAELYEEAVLLLAERRKKDKSERLTEADSDRRRIHQERYKKFSQIEREFLDAKSVRVEKEEWGEVAAEYTILNREATLDKPPIFFILGTSNGLKSGDSLVRRLALRKLDRRVVVLGWPDAPGGHMTQGFFDEVMRGKDYEAHVEFFRVVIGTILEKFSAENGGKDNNVLFEGWGYSGAVRILEKLAEATDLRERMVGVVGLCPYATVDQTFEQTQKGAMVDFLQMLKNWPAKLARYVFIDDPTPELKEDGSGESGGLLELTGDNLTQLTGAGDDKQKFSVEERQQKAWKFNSFTHLGRNGTAAHIWKSLGKMSVKGGGKIAFISGKQDRVTNSLRLLNPRNEKDLQQYQPELRVGVVSGGHVDPFLNPDKWIDEVERLQS